jgi:hypothetical protein
MKRIIIAQLALAIGCVSFTETFGRDVFLNTFVPRMDALIARGLEDLGEITCTYSTKGKKLYSIRAAISEPYAVLEFRKNGKGWDSVRNPDYYAAVNVTSDGPYSVTHLIKSTDDSWSTIIERRKLPLFSLIMTGNSTIPELARSGAYSVVHKKLDSGSEFTLTANKEIAYRQIILEFDSKHDFPVARTEYFDESKSNGSKYIASKFEAVGEVHFPTSIHVVRFSGDKNGEMTIDTTFDRAKELDIERCNLEAYGIVKPNFELANQGKSHLPTIFATAVVLIVASGSVWYYFRKPKL